MTVYSETPPRLLRKLGAFDVTPEPGVQELDVWLLAGETFLTLIVGWLLIPRQPRKD